MVMCPQKSRAWEIELPGLGGLGVAWRRVTNPITVFLLVHPVLGNKDDQDQGRLVALGGELA